MSKTMNRVLNDDSYDIEKIKNTEPINAIVSNRPTNAVKKEVNYLDGILKSQDPILGELEIWESGIDYDIGFTVKHVDTNYLCINAHTSTIGETPDLSSNWRVEKPLTEKFLNLDGGSLTGDLNLGSYDVLDVENIHLNNSLVSNGWDGTELSFLDDTIQLKTNNNTIINIQNDYVNISNDLVVDGSLTVNGTTTTVNSTTIQVDDKNIELGSIDTPTDTSANGGGITLKGDTDKTILFSSSTNTWDFSLPVKSDSFTSTETTLAPLNVSSTTLVDNLNSDLLDGKEGSYYLDYSNFTNTPTHDNYQYWKLIDELGTEVNIGSLNSITLSGANGISVEYTDGELVFTNTDLGASQNIFKNITVQDLDSGFTWAETGTFSSSINNDTFKFVSSENINVNIDTTYKAIQLEVKPDLSIDTLTVNTGGKITSEGDTDTYIEFYTDNRLRVMSNNTQRFEVNTSGAQVNGNLIVTGDYLSTGDWNLQSTSSTLDIVFSNTFTSLMTFDVTSLETTVAGDLNVNGGDIILGGTGRIQGIDLVTDDTDAVNKLYVDTALEGAGEFKLTTDGNPGWVLKYRTLNTDKYGGLGLNAVDLSISTESTNENGAAGESSFVVGRNNLATGLGAFVAGIDNSVYNQYSVALGYLTSSNGIASTSLGYGTTASGDSSIVVGKNGGIGTSSGTIFGVAYSDTLTGGINAQTNDTNLVFTVNTTGDTNISGDLVVGGTITETSDERLKENIITLDNSLEKISKLRGVEYNLKSNPDKNQIGFIAQEVEEIVPELVETDDEGFKSVSYQRTVALLVEALKEQQKEIEYLKSKIQ